MNNMNKNIAKTMRKVIHNLKTGITLIILLLSLSSLTNAQPEYKPFIGNNMKMAKWVIGGKLYANHHINVDYFVQRLLTLGANTYLYGMELPNALEDLKLLLPKAKANGISIWIYLKPPLQQPPLGPSYSEPYRLDYVKWAEEIAKLSLRYSNLKGYVIDDFFTDTYPYNSNGIFTESYVNRFVNAGKAINPKIKFYPVMYYHMLVRAYEPHPYDMVFRCSDGIVTPYPGFLASYESLIGPMADTTCIRRGIEIAAARCRSRIVVSLESNVSTTAGDYGRVSQNVSVTNQSKASITVHYIFGGTKQDDEYHRFQVWVDDKVVWSAGMKYGLDYTTTIDLTPYVSGKSSVKISVGIGENKGVGNLHVTGSLDIVSASGINLNTDIGNESVWTKENKNGKFVIDIVKSLNKTLGTIVMPAADSLQYTMRYTDPATPANIAGRINRYSKFIQKHEIEGIINFGLDMNEGSKYYNEVSNVFNALQESIK